MARVIFGLLLGLSIILNVGVLARMPSGDRPRVMTTRTIVTAESRCPGHEQLQRELQELRQQMVRQDSRPVTSSVVEQDPIAGPLLRDQDALSGLWERLEQLNRIRSQMEDQRFEHLSLEATAETLGLPRDAFVPLASEVLRELRMAARDFGLTVERTPPEAYEEVAASYEGRRQQALARLNGCLGGSTLHRRFLDNVDLWTSLLLQE